MRVVLLTVLFVAMTHAWAFRRTKGRFNHWNKWSVSTVDKDESDGGSVSKWGSKFGNRLIEKATEKINEVVEDKSEEEESKTAVGSVDPVTTTDKRTMDSDSDDLDKTDSDKVRTDSKTDFNKSDIDEADNFGEEDESEEKDDKSRSDDKHSKHDSEDKDMTKFGRTDSEDEESDFEKRSFPKFDKDSDDFEDLDSSFDKFNRKFDSKFDKVSGEFEEKFGSKLDLPKFEEDGSSMDFPIFKKKFLFGGKFDGKDSSMERDFDFPKFDPEDKDETVSDETDSSIDTMKPQFGFPPKFNKHSDREDSSMLDTEDFGSSHDDDKPTYWKKRFDWRKPSQPVTTPCPKDKESKDSEDDVVVVTDDDVNSDPVVEDVEPVADDETTVDVEGETLEAVVPEPSMPSTPNWGPTRRV